jgi:glycosyltransferase involved in cell wall biosynthesis
MRIIAFVRKDSGPCYHRIIMPLMLMDGPDIFITNNLLEEHFEKGCDIFIYNRVLPAHQMPRIHELQKKYGFKICVDIDDYWFLDEHHILYQEYLQTGFAAHQIQQLKDADIVLTTHSRLAEEIKWFNKNVHVSQNAIPHLGQFAIEREPYHLTRLFWQGSITHQEDIKLLSVPIFRIPHLLPKIKMVMAGYQEDEVWYQMAKTYTAQLKHQYKLIPGGPVDSYYSAYKDADICLVPLVNSVFNRMKSNLKVLEAANLGLPVIASDVHPYKDMPLLHCNGSADWIKHITRLVKSKKRQKEVGQELKEFCDEHYNFHRINSERKQVLEYEASKVNA